MNLYLLRHGIAVPNDDPEIHSDGERPLTPKGIKRMRRAAKGLGRLRIPFDAILTSPLIRARQSADIIAEILGLTNLLEEISGLAPESSVDHLLFSLTRFKNHEHLLLVGHEPLLSMTIGFLLTHNNGVVVNTNLKKGGICRIDIDSLPPTTAGTLHWLLTPKQLRALAAPAE